MTRKPVKGRGRKAVAKRKPAKRKPVKRKPFKLPLAALSVEAWCRTYGIGKNSFYKMLRQGNGPATIKIGRRRIISNEASTAWQRSQERVEVAA